MSDNGHNEGLFDRLPARALLSEDRYWELFDEKERRRHPRADFKNGLVHNHGVGDGPGQGCRETLVNGELKGECLAPDKRGMADE